MCAKNHLLIFSSFLDIWENVEWPRFFLDHPVYYDIATYSVYDSAGSPCPAPNAYRATNPARSLVGYLYNK